MTEEELDHYCLSGKYCVARTSTGPALTVKPNTLCHGCIDEIQGLYDSLPDLRLGVATFLGGLKGTSYGSKVSSSGEPPTPVNVHVFDILVDLDAWLKLPKKPVRDIVNSGNPYAALHIRKTARKAHGVLVPKRSERVWERRHANCPKCNLPSLGNFSGSDSIQCSNCGGVMTRDEYDAQCLVQGA